MQWSDVLQNPHLQNLPFKIVQTTDGVRVADVAWVSNKRLMGFALATPFPAAPEICVEIMSPGDTWAEMHMKAELYLQASAHEGWVVAVDGKRKVIKPST